MEYKARPCVSRVRSANSPWIRDEGSSLSSRLSASGLRCCHRSVSALKTLNFQFHSGLSPVRLIPSSKSLIAAGRSPISELARALLKRASRENGFGSTTTADCDLQPAVVKMSNKTAADKELIMDSRYHCRCRCPRQS